MLFYVSNLKKRLESENSNLKLSEFLKIIWYKIFDNSEFLTMKCVKLINSVHIEYRKKCNPPKNNYKMISGHFRSVNYM